MTRKAGNRVRPYNPPVIVQVQESRIHDGSLESEETSAFFGKLIDNHFGCKTS